MKTKYLPFLALSIIPVAAADVHPLTTVNLKSLQGSLIRGDLALTQDITGVVVTGAIIGLVPNSEHGIHVHEKGDCSAPDGSSAGPHFNPTAQLHGEPGHGSHVGDLGNIKADRNGVAVVFKTVMGANLEEGDPLSVLNRSIIIHTKKDDLKTQPSGGSGTPIACGVIVTEMVADPT